MITYDVFESNLASVKSRIEAACLACGREPSSVQLLPVTKNHPEAAVEYALRSGLTSVGENRVQEAAEKQKAVAGELRWELIGHLQSNKAKEAVTVFDRIQSVDSLKLLRRLERLAGEAERRISILLQCNTGEDPNKFGFRVSEMESALEVAFSGEHLTVDGLMTVAPLDDNLDIAKAAFERLRETRDSLAYKFDCSLRELSMGMTGDLEVAIAAGSTQIRVGTALYGARDYNSNA